MVVAAKCALQHPLEGRYVAEMECSPVAAYHHLFAYHASCRAVAKQVLRDVLPAPVSNNEPDVDSDTPVPAVQYRPRAAPFLRRREVECEETRMSPGCPGLGQE